MSDNNKHVASALVSMALMAGATSMATAQELPRMDDEPGSGVPQEVVDQMEGDQATDDQAESGVDSTAAGDVSPAMAVERGNPAPGSPDAMPGHQRQAVPGNPGAIPGELQGSPGQALPYPTANQPQAFSMPSEDGKTLSMTESELLATESRLKQEARVWDARVEIAKKRLDFQKANNEMQMMSSGPAVQTGGAALSEEEILEKMQEMSESQNNQGSEETIVENKESDQADIILLSVFGPNDSLMADVSYNGGILRVETGSRLGDWRVSQIEPTRLILSQNDRKREVVLKQKTGG